MFDGMCDDVRCRLLVNKAAATAMCEIKTSQSLYQLAASGRWPQRYSLETAWEIERLAECYNYVSFALW